MILCDNKNPSLYSHLYVDNRIQPDFQLTVIFPNNTQKKYQLHKDILKNFDYFNHRFNFEEKQASLNTSLEKNRKENILKFPEHAFLFFEGDYKNLVISWENCIIPYLYNSKQIDITNKCLFDIFPLNLDNMQVFLASIIISDFMLLDNFKKKSIRELSHKLQSENIIELASPVAIVPKNYVAKNTEYPTQKSLFCMTPAIIHKIKDFFEEEKYQVDYDLLERMIVPDLSSMTPDEIIKSPLVKAYINAD